VADVHAGLRERGAQFRDRAWQQVGRKLERDADPQRSAARRNLAGDCGERPVVPGYEGTGLTQQDRFGAR